MEFKDNLDDISRVISNDGVILYPTDTIWGLGCNPFSEIAVKKLYQIKKRDTSKPLILLVNGLEMLKAYVNEIHPRIETLLVYHHKPLTVIYPQAKNIPNWVLGNQQSVAIRIPDDPFCLALITNLNQPICSSSANFSGTENNGTFSDIDPKLIKQCDYVSQHRQNDLSISTPSVLVTYDKKGNLDFLRT